MLTSSRTIGIGTILALGAVLASGLAGCEKYEKLPPQLPAPPGPGAAQTELDYEQMRAEMVKQLRRQGLLQSQAVIGAMKATRRHLFVPEQVRYLAYYDTPLPIGEDQTISAPCVVAKMTELLDPPGGGHRFGLPGSSLSSPGEARLHHRNSGAAGRKRGKAPERAGIRQCHRVVRRWVSGLARICSF